MNGFAGACLKIFCPFFRFLEKKDRSFFSAPAVKIACDFRRQARVLFSDIFPDSERSRRKSVLFLSEKGPSSAVKNRKRFSTADGEKKNLRFFFCPPFRFLWNRKDGGPLRFQRNLRGLRKKGEFFPLPIFAPTPKEFGKNPSFFLVLFFRLLRSRKKRTNLPRLRRSRKKRTRKKDPRLPSKIASDFDGRRRKEKSWICSFALRAIRQIRDRSENRMRFSERSSIFLFQEEEKVSKSEIAGSPQIP